MGKRYFWLFILVSFIGITCVSIAVENNRGGGKGRVLEPRVKGVPQFGSFHTTRPGAKPVRSQVMHDRRSHSEIRRDPHTLIFSPVGWHPAGHWNHWYRDWGVFWRMNDWNEIQTVTCEAVDTQTELLYPVTDTRLPSWYWNGDLVNNLAAKALDECAAESGNPANCALVERECWNSVY